MKRLKVGLCQINTRVGDLDHNVERILAAYESAAADGAQVAIFPELAVTGYPPEDLLLKAGFLAAGAEAVDYLASQIRPECIAVVGWVKGSRPTSGPRHDPFTGPWNAAAVMTGGEPSIAGDYLKQCLPNYAVFDEMRYFESGPGAQETYEVANAQVAVTICEDIWVRNGPVVAAATAGAEVVLNLNASPFHAGKQVLREETLVARTLECGLPIAYVNQVGGQDELVFDGGSMVVDGGELLARLPRFSECVEVVEIDLDHTADSASPDVALVGAIADSEESEEELWKALCLGTADYVHKNGFSEVVLGLSGGVDSALVAAVAADALGPENVHVVLMPSRYSSDHSVHDAEELAANLGLDQRTINIEAGHSAFTEMLAESFDGVEADLTEENIQSRVRGVLLMALSNKFGWLVLTTGNKSETAVGYSTLYGDSAGGLAVIKDLPKLDVYALCRWRNSLADGPWIPENILAKPPSAELRPDQRDDQSLPPYEVLDPLISDYVDGDMTSPELVAAGHDPDLVARVVRLVDLAEYKRRQSPPGIRVSEKAFGRDRRLPITNGYRSDPRK